MDARGGNHSTAVHGWRAAMSAFYPLPGPGDEITWGAIRSKSDPRAEDEEEEEVSVSKFVLEQAIRALVDAHLELKGDPFKALTSNRCESAARGLRTAIALE